MRVRNNDRTRQPIAHWTEEFQDDKAAQIRDRSRSDLEEKAEREVEEGGHMVEMDNDDRVIQQSQNREELHDRVHESVPMHRDNLENDR